MKTYTATMLGVGRLYKYQAFYLDRLCPILLNNSLYFSKPNDFNDPWDCRPCYSDSVCTDDGYRDRLIERIDQSSRGSENLARFRADPSLLKSHVRRFSDEIWPEINKRYRVYCTSMRPDCALMWAHYADKHTGVCLEFDISLLKEISDSTLQVLYCNRYPNLDAAEYSVTKRLLPLITKSDDWSYEEEFRIIAQEKSSATLHNTLMTQSNFFIFPPNVLKAIILGCRLPRSNEERIREIVKERAHGGHPLALKRAVPIPNRYAVAIVSC